MTSHIRCASARLASAPSGAAAEGDSTKPAMPHMVVGPLAVVVSRWSLVVSRYSLVVSDPWYRAAFGFRRPFAAFDDETYAEGRTRDARACAERSRRARVERGRSSGEVDVQIGDDARQRQVEAAAAAAARDRPVDERKLRETAALVAPEQHP